MIDYACSLEEISARLRLPRERVYRLEQEALIKMRVGLMLVELVGQAAADRVLATLRGRPLSHWRRALSDALVAAGRFR